MAHSNTQKKTISGSRKEGALAMVPTYAFDLPPLAPLDVIDLSPECLSDFDGTFYQDLMDCLAEKDFRKAAARTEQHLKQDPKNTALMNLAGALSLHAGDIDAAYLTLSRAAKITTRDEKIINNLACAAMHKRDYVRAVDILTDGLRHISPVHAQYYYNLAASLYEIRSEKTLAYLERADSIAVLPEAIILRAILGKVLGNPSGACDLLLKGANRFPAHDHLKYYLAYMLFDQERQKEAFTIAGPLVLLYPKNTYYGILYANIVRTMNFHAFQPQHKHTVANALQCPGVNTRFLESAWESILFCHPTFCAFCTPIDTFSVERADLLIDALKEKEELDEPFLIYGLPRVLNRTLPMEIVFSTMRDAYLRRVTGGKALDPADRSFLASLALYCHHNEYIFDISPEERDLIQQVKPHDLSAENTADRLMILCCYAPITAYLSEDQALSFKAHPGLGPLVKEQVIERQTEIALMKTIPALTRIHDDVSRAVEKMYIENPYPTWIHVNYGGDPFYLHLAPRQKDRCQMLIAGCGTGQHSITAALNYENCDVLAIDLSRRSLAYAMRKTQELGLPHLRYAQADILELGSLGQKFDIIESAGVLHHLADPIKGLEVLLGLLKPMGLLRLGLYSETARQAVVAARAYVQEKTYPPTLDGIRAFRRDVIRAPEGDPIRGVLAFGDFFSTSTCRDLVFHVQEHRYTIPQLKKILEYHKLDFATFNLDSIPMGQFKELFQNQNDVKNLDYWAEFEEKYPSTFTGMYQFWVQKMT